MARTANRSRRSVELPRLRDTGSFADHLRRQTRSARRLEKVAEQDARLWDLRARRELLSDELASPRFMHARTPGLTPSVEEAREYEHVQFARDLIDAETRAVEAKRTAAATRYIDVTRHARAEITYRVTMSTDRRPRARGAGRPAARPSTSSTSSGGGSDSSQGSDDPPGDLLPALPSAGGSVGSRNQPAASRALNGGAA